MKPSGFSAGLVIGVLWMGLAACVGVAAAGQPVVMWQVGDIYAAPYDAVWDATLRSLGVVKTRVADKSTGRVETEPFSFDYTVGAGLQGGTQVISVSFRIQVVRAGQNRTDVLVRPVIHDSLLSGFTPGPTNNPWQDLFARIRSNLGGSARTSSDVGGPPLQATSVSGPPQGVLAAWPPVCEGRVASRPAPQFRTRGTQFRPRIKPGSWLPASRPRTLARGYCI